MAQNETMYGLNDPAAAAKPNEKNEFLYDLKTPETTWKGMVQHTFPNGGEPASDVGRITPPEGPHGLYWFLDSLMHKVPDRLMDTWQGPHYHVHGYETFFVDSGKVYLYINGQRVLCTKGDIIHLQAGQAHGFKYLEDTKWRGTYHDLEKYSESDDVNRVKNYCPELKDDPELLALAPRGEMDTVIREPLLYKDAPVEECLAVKHIDRPHAAYEFPGVSMRVLVERWENGGTKELACAVCEPGFTAEWVKYPPLRELLYVREGKVKFTVLGKEFIADDECVVDIPRFAPHSIEVLEHSEIYDLGGQTWWSMFLQCLESVKVNAPARYTEETIENFKKKFKVQIKSIGMK